MEDLSDLYQEIILAHNKRPRNGKPLIPCTHQADGFNPLCGDKLTVYLRKPDEQMDEIACNTEGCAISR
ncbi:MAG: iron-sulfur cluster assembly scaffold protein, partial [Verrucomicrobiales bacterium]|nr:iron-sulfur cluster assembly scaffold protein [Verrucomicrobiales bacterium]